MSEVSPLGSMQSNILAISSDDAITVPLIFITYSLVFNWRLSLILIGWTTIPISIAHCLLTDAILCNKSPPLLSSANGIRP